MDAQREVIRLTEALDEIQDRITDTHDEEQRIRDEREELHDEEERCIIQLQLARERLAAGPPPLGRRDADDEQGGFAIGDRVYVTNRLGSLFTTEDSEYDRLATVVGFRPGKVVIRTYNDQESWRYPENLRLLNRREVEQIRLREIALRQE